MEEKIIIDGVKVEECSYYNKENTPYCCEVWDNECEAQNCYYKQLKRLEQERDKYKHALEEIKKIASKVMTDDWTIYIQYANGYDNILQIITEAIGE